MKGRGQESVVLLRLRGDAQTNEWTENEIWLRF